MHTLSRALIRYGLYLRSIYFVGSIPVVLWEISPELWDTGGVSPREVEAID
jgi:hypothetical protein